MADELTVARLELKVRRDLGWRKPSDWPAETPATELANDVGEWLVSTHDWNWLVRPPTYLELVTGQGYCDLPDDFTRHIDLVSASASSYGISLEDPKAVGRAQVEGVSTSARFVACFTHGAPTTAGPRAKVRLDLGPIPTESLAQAFVLTYRGGWTTVEIASDHIVLPRFMQALYVRACCAWLGGTEQERRGSIEDRLDRLVQSYLWQAAVDRDDTQQQELGHMRGGVGESMSSDEEGWPFPRANGAVPVEG